MRDLCTDLVGLLDCPGCRLCTTSRLRLESQTVMLALLPPVVCLCGSTRFMDAFHAANRRLSLAGEIVLTVEIVTYDGADDPQRADPAQKQRLDALHLKKIDLCDYVYVLNVGGYIGESTRREIAYAEDLDKPVVYLEAVNR